MTEQHVALIVCDQEFHYGCDDPEVYVDELFNFIRRKEEGKEIVFKTVSGRYSFLNNLFQIQVENKNKTTFVKSLAGYLDRIDEAVIISNYRGDPFLTALKNELGEEEIPTTLFSYKVKDNGQGKT